MHAKRSQGWSDVAVRICTRDAIEAALFVSTLSSKPLKEPPYPFDDQREWAGIWAGRPAASCPIRR